MNNVDISQLILVNRKRCDHGDPPVAETKEGSEEEGDVG